MKNNRLIIILTMLSIAIIGPRPSGGAYEPELFTKEEMIDSIYKFQRLMNQETCPTMEDNYSLFPAADNGGTENACRDFLKDIPVKESCGPIISPQASCLFAYLRSKNGPLFRSTNGDKISIYIEADFKEVTENKTINIDALIKTNDGVILPAIFSMTGAKCASSDFGHIQILNIKGNTLDDYIEADFIKYKKQYTTNKP